MKYIEFRFWHYIWKILFTIASTCNIVAEKTLHQAQRITRKQERILQQIEVAK